MLSWTALLCVAGILKGVFTLPTDASPMTSAGGVDNSTATLGSRDSSSAVFGFYDSCPTDIPDAKLKGGAVQKYTLGDCKEVHSKGQLMMINWKAGGFDTLMTYSDKNCKELRDKSTPDMDLKMIQSADRVESCVDAVGPSKILSVQGVISQENKRDILPSAATLTRRDTEPQPTGEDPWPLPEAVDFVDHCKWDAAGYPQEAKSLGGRVDGYIIGTCQTVDPGGPLMSIVWLARGFDSLTFYKDPACKDEMAATKRPRYGFHEASCFDFSKLPKLLSFKGERSEGKEKREILSSSATLSKRDTLNWYPGGLNVIGGIDPPDPPLPEAVNFFDRCPYDPSGKFLDVNGTGGQVTGYIVGTCQKIDSPSPTMMVNYKDGNFDRMVIYHDKDCKDRITAYDRGKTTWKDFSCIDLSKLQKVLSFKGVVMHKSR